MIIKKSPIGGYVERGDYDFNRNNLYGRVSGNLGYAATHIFQGELPSPWRKLVRVSRNSYEFVAEKVEEIQIPQLISDWEKATKQLLASQKETYRTGRPVDRFVENIFRREGRRISAEGIVKIGDSLLKKEDISTGYARVDKALSNWNPES